jgi:hypothetical protein
MFGLTFDKSSSAKKQNANQTDRTRSYFLKAAAFS